MKPVLRYLIDITRHMERRTLDHGLVDALQSLADAREVTLFEFHHRHDQCWMRRRVESSVQALRSENGTSVGTGVGLSVGADKRSHLVSEQPALQHCIEQHAAIALAPGPGQTILHWIPLWRGEQVRGCLCLIRAVPLSTDNLDQIAAILEIYKNFLALLDYSEEDSLTGLLNRKTFDQQFGELVGALDDEDTTQAPGQPERRDSGSAIDNWLAVIDIDHFKQVNDQYGHLYGDEVLILLANLLKQAFREQDRVYRFGGEEFVVLLRSATLDNARKSFERLRESVDSHRFPQIDHVTISIGFVSIGSQTPVTILGQADQALYFAKQNGRNRVCFYDELVSSGELNGMAVNNDVDFF